MTTWLKPVRDALDNARAPVPVFIRDDDAGWDDERLIGLLDLLAGLGLPVDLAAIPTQVGPALARELCERIDAPGPRSASTSMGWRTSTTSAKGARPSSDLRGRPATSAATYSRGASGSARSSAAA
jgi:hypothetical protein